MVNNHNHQAAADGHAAEGLADKGHAFHPPQCKHDDVGAACLSSDEQTIQQHALTQCRPCLCCVPCGPPCLQMFPFYKQHMDEMQKVGGACTAVLGFGRCFCHCWMGFSVTAR